MARFSLIVLLVLWVGDGLVMGQNISATDAGIVEVQLSGSASWHMGEVNDTGFVTLKASRTGKSRVDLQLGTGRRSEIFVNDPVEPKGYLYSNSEWKEAGLHNNWVDANWFFPAFSTAAVGSERAFTLSSTGANSLRSQFTVPGRKPKTTRLIQVLSTADFDLDPTTHLLTSMRWVTHPDDDYGVNIPVEVRYADYRDVNGVKVPFHIERYFNGTLQLEIAVSNVVFNPGLLVSDFTPSTN